MAAAGAALALLAALGGVWLLRRAWRRRGGGGAILIGWGLLAAAAGAWRLTGAAPDKALAFALLAPSFAALALVAAGAEAPVPGGARPARVRDGGIEPPAQGAAPWRGVVRAQLAGPAGAVAAVALAAAVELHLPASAGVRLAAAGFLLPAAWAGAMVWATTDDRLGRVAGGLGALTVLGLAGGWL